MILANSSKIKRWQKTFSYNTQIDATKVLQKSRMESLPTDRIKTDEKA